MKLTDARDGARLHAVRQLYQSAFPDAERKPFSLLLKKQREGSVDIFALEDEGTFCGLAILAKREDLVLLDYFAVLPERRGKGAGSRALAAIRANYPGKRFFLEIEDAFRPSDNAEQRQRRRAFYLKNGMTPMPFRVDLFGVCMEIFTDGCLLDFREYLNFYAAVFGEQIRARIRPAF